MILQRWRVILAMECIFICVSELSLEKRRCAFLLNGKTNLQQIYKFVTAGNVSGSVQVCENTQCCVGYYQIIDGQQEVDILACAVVKKSCPESTCKAKTVLYGRGISCACNTDFCNNNITWTPHSEQRQVNYTHSKGELIIWSVMILVGTLLIICFMITAAKWRRLLREKKENVQARLLCSCQTIKTNKIDIDDIELQQIVGRGDFATVLQGKFQGSTVAVKVFPADWKYKFTAEKEVYELPLMKHTGILHFLGTGRKPEGSCFIVSQFAEHGSLHSFLCEHTTSWTLSLKLCQSLSQGLSYLHSDLRRYDEHKPPVAHGDLTSSNVLVRADSTCVLCDFGCSTILRSCSGRHSWQSDTMVMRSGTLRYMSPEFLEGCANISSSCCLLQGDIYALGLLLWEIWMRCSDLFEGSVTPQHLLPYESELGGDVTLESLISYVSNLDKRPPIPKNWELLPQGSALQELLTDCWDRDPDARLTAQCAADRLVSLQSCFS